MSPPAPTYVGALMRMFGQPRQAFSISELAAVGPLSRSLIYKAIRDGNLVARKVGDRTIVLAADWDAFLQALPRLGIDVPIQEPPALIDARKAAKSK